MYKSRVCSCGLNISSNCRSAVRHGPMLFDVRWQRGCSEILEELAKDAHPAAVVAATRQKAQVDFFFVFLGMTRQVD